MPVRIRWLTLTDFRAFPGPAPTLFELDGKNLLVYGENGAGKSSIFHALKGLFALDDRKPLLEQRNVFSGQADDVCKIAVNFSGDDADVAWTANYHPTQLDFTKPVRNFHTYFFAGSEPRVTDAALRTACLDYRALLDTNYRHCNGEVNLFTREGSGSA